MMVVGALALTGCTGSSSEPVPADSATADPSPTGPPASVTPTVLTPVMPDELTDASAQAETTRIADAIQALVDPALIVNVDDNSQLRDKTESDGRYFGILRTITLDPTSDAVSIATAMVASLEPSGWITLEISNKGGIFINAMTSGTDEASAWFVVVGADASVPGEAVLSIQLASPDIP